MPCFALEVGVSILAWDPLQKTKTVRRKVGGAVVGQCMQRVGSLTFFRCVDLFLMMMISLITND